MRAHARLGASADARGRTRIDRLRSQPPMVLRPTLPVGDVPTAGWNLHGAARVSLAASAAGPVGGDDLRLDVDIGPGAALVVRTVAATLALPGPHGQPSRTVTTLRVADGGTLLWLPEPLIAANGCDHHADTYVELATSARLVAREELILGRHGEPPGAVNQHLRVTRDGAPLHDQDTRIGGPGWQGSGSQALGSQGLGWRGPAVTGGRTALGSVLVADPARDGDTERHRTAGADSAVLPLRRGALLVTALAHDAHTLRRRLDVHLATLHDPAGDRAGTAPDRVPARTA